MMRSQVIVSFHMRVCVLITEIVTLKTSRQSAAEWGSSCQRNVFIAGPDNQKHVGNRVSQLTFSLKDLLGLIGAASVA